MVDKETLTKEEITPYLPSNEDTREEVSRVNLRNHQAENFRAAMEPEKRKETLTEGSINKQIKDLIRKRAELRKRGKTEDSETREEFRKAEDRAYPPPLPQRAPKIRPWVISNIRLLPSRSAECSIENTRDINLQIRKDPTDKPESKEAWVKVARRRKGSERRREQMEGDLSARPEYPANREIDNNNVRSNKSIKLNRKPPKNAAVLVTSYKEELSYADVIKMARQKISLDELKIQSTKIRRAANGGMIIEVLGPDSHDRADALADKLKTILQNQVKVIRPMVKSDIRLVGLDDSVSVEEVMYVVAQNGTCKEEEIKTGPIRKMNNGLSTVWV